MTIRDEYLPLESLLPDTANYNRHDPEDVALLASQIVAVGFTAPFLVDAQTRTIAAGHRRRLALLKLRAEHHAEPAGVQPGWFVPCRVGEWTELQRLKVLIGDNPDPARIDYDGERLTALLAELQNAGELEGSGYDEARLEELIGELAGEEPIPSRSERSGAGANPEEVRRTLAERFGVPPFSVLDARQGYWQTRKRAWIGLGIQSELGRGADAAPDGIAHGALAVSDMRGEHTVGGLTWTGKAAELDGYRVQNGERESTQVSGTSIFDPVLCELVYRWFCPEGGAVLDPFAGGSVRGIVAAKLGRRYTGIDLRTEQVAANEAQAAEIVTEASPRWIVGDSREAQDLAPGEYDLVFSCPPYADLEVYSDDPRDLSAMEYARFIDAYRQIIAQAVGMLRQDRFACFVVGDVRDPRGFYRNFVSDTIAAFQDAGATLYNEAILVTAVGSLPIRVGRQFGAYRKLGKTHQNVLVFYKGDPKRIGELAGDCEFGDLSSTDEGAEV